MLLARLKVLWLMLMKNTVNKVHNRSRSDHNPLTCPVSILSLPATIYDLHKISVAMGVVRGEGGGFGGDCQTGGGGSLSAMLFDACLHDLDVALCEAVLGCDVAGHHVNCLVYADNVALICPSAKPSIKFCLSLNTGLMSIASVYR